MDRLVVLGNSVDDTLLARIRTDAMDKAGVRFTVGRLYQTLIKAAICNHAPKKDVAIPTSMAAYDPERGIWRGQTLDTSVPIVISAIARGGLKPSDVVLDELAMYGFHNSRMDCLMLNRTTDPKDGHVTGVDIQGVKMGSSIEGAIVIYPDCMVATGGSLIKARAIYEQHGRALKHIVCALICAPEGIAAVMNAYPDTWIYTVAVDVGLNDRQYILPGAGDMGNKSNGPSDFFVQSGKSG